MTTIRTAVAVLAVVAAAVPSTRAQGVCGRISNQVACENKGCRWQSGCRQPTACSASSGEYITYDGDRTGIQVLRHPVSPEVAELCDTDVECGARYIAHLSFDFVTGGPNCNDVAMLPPHGIDQRECTAVDGTAYPTNKMKDLRRHPFPNNGVKQSLAMEAGSTTALLESGINCRTTAGNGDNTQCAFPYGFKTDMIHKRLGICVEVRNVQDRWVEIKAEPQPGSGGASFCVRDRNAPIDQELGCTVAAGLHEIRESGNSVGTDNMNVIFYAQDNTDDSEINIWWRITGSHVVTSDPDPTSGEGEAENWSLHRSANDFPDSFGDRYAKTHQGFPVFQASTGSSASWTAPTAALVTLLAVLAVFLA